MERWNPASTAIVTDGSTWTYGDLDRRIRETAGWLRARGIEPGDVVAVRLGKCTEFLLLHLGAMALGAAILPMHPAATEAEATYLREDAGAKLFIDEVPELVGPPVDPVEVDPDTIAILLYTSGTTGRPKGAPISHRNLLAMVRSLHQAWHWRADDVLLHALPLFHVHGLFVAQWGAMYAGATAIWLDRFDVDAVLDALPRCTVFMGVPTYYARLLAAGPREPLPGMRLFTSGSAPLPAAHHHAFQEQFGHRILERYGMTEIGIVLSNPYEGERRPGAVGFPLPGVEARVADSEDQDVPIGTVGEICIRSDSVFGGYLHRPEATAKVLIDGWMHTGDLGWIDEDGYIHVAGRAGDMILSGGFNVYPGEIEAALRDVAGHGLECAVFGVPDEDLGEKVAVAWVGELDHAAAAAALAERLSPYKRPRRWFQVDELPRNSMGKVQKARLRARFGVHIRPATLNDLDVLVHGNLALAESTEGIHLDPGVVREGVRRGLQRCRYWVAERGDRVVGQAMVTTEWSDWRNGEQWWLQSVWVEPDARHTGVFRSLYEHVRSTARAAGAIGIRLYVHRDNAGASAVYERMGMTRTSYRIDEHPIERRM